MKRLLLTLIILAVLILPVSAEWEIKSPDHTGYIQFYDGGIGIVHVDNYPAITFNYKHISGDNYEARYLWYALPFTVKEGVITSSKVPGASVVWSADT